MRKFIISFCCYVFFIFTLAAQDKAPHYTVIVSLDAFRWDYPAMYDTPNLNQMAREGVKATMLPSYPASTFPNHYTLATGLVPDHNGIINNTFWDVKRRRQYSMGDPATRLVRILPSKAVILLTTGNMPRSLVLLLNSGWIRPSLFWKSRKRNVPVSLCFTLKSRMASPIITAPAV